MCVCFICKQVMMGPLVIKNCQHGYCDKCLKKYLKDKKMDDSQCPQCPQTIKPDDIQISKHLEGLIDTLRVPCPIGCKSYITFEEYYQHKSYCDPVKENSKLLASCFKTANNSSNNNIVEVKQRGPSFYLQKISKARVANSEASPSTVRKRKASAITMLEETTKDVPHIKKKLCEKEIPIISAEESVSMMASLNFTWYKYKDWSGWMRKFNIKVPSEKKMRAVMGKWLEGKHILCEKVPMMFNEVRKGDKNGKKFQIVKETPMAYVPNLKEFVLRHIDYLDEAGALVQHEFLNNEIHLKFGGDHGKGSFKQSIQICNVKNPNNKDNTIVINYFEAKDCKYNLKTALSQYKEDIESLQMMQWRDKSIRVFMFGDYDNIAEMYGLSGASGRHPCLWCDISASDMKKACEERTSSTRSLNSLEEDLHKFQQEGLGDLNKAKEYNNVIDNFYFRINLDQVVVPGLHLTLGIFLKLYELFEKECRQLDYLVQNNSIFNNNAIEKIIATEESIKNLKDALATCSNTYQWYAIHGTSEEKNTVKTQFEVHSDAVEKQIERKIEELKMLRKLNKLEGGGHITEQLDKFLASVNVKRQAYYSNCFNGNHCHILLKPINYTRLCNIPVEQTMGKSTKIVNLAHKVSEKYTKIFGLFSQCHKLYNSRDTVDIPSLKSAITSFLTTYRSEWPTETFPPKMHFLEDHVVPFIQKWKVGFGFYGEQGGESIHKEFASISSHFVGMEANPVGRLCQTLKRHHVKTHPVVKKHLPVKGSRKKCC